MLRSSEERLSTGVPGLKLKIYGWKKRSIRPPSWLSPTRLPGTCALFCLVVTEPSFSRCLRPVPSGQSPWASALTAFPFRPSLCARTQGRLSSLGCQRWASSDEGASWEMGALPPWHRGINSLKFDPLSTNFLRPRQILPEKNKLLMGVFISFISV